MIDSVEFHEEILPDTMDWRQATQHIATIVLWAYKRGLLDSNFCSLPVFTQGARKLEEANTDISTFVSDALDGALIEGYFLTETIEFVTDYVKLGIYYQDLEKFFRIGSIYELPSDIQTLASFFDVLDERYQIFSDTGQFPVYKTLKTMKYDP